MTSINVTIAADRAVLSQDRSLYVCGDLPPVSTEPTFDYAKAAANTFQGGGVAGTSIGSVNKIAVLPRLLIGASGAFAHSSLLPYRLHGELDDAVGLAPNILRAMVTEVASNIHELIVVVAGYSELERRVLGYVFERSQGFEPIRLDRGHSSVPVANPAAPGYAHLAALWMPAALGSGVEQFHNALHANQLWSYRQGLLRAAISEEHDIASVDRTGARMH